MRKAVHAVAYLAYVAIFIIGVDYLFYRGYIRRVYKENAPIARSGSLPSVKNVDALTMSRLGNIETDKESSFIHFDTVKKDGMVRIGCFGDSYVQGAEVSGGYDYPSLLQGIFLKNGYTNVEVINFGSSSHSFGQAFIMWRSVGIKYGLDRILLGPYGFYEERDLAFNHTRRKNIYYMHARFILKDTKAELVDLLGTTCEERTGNYYRFLPPLRYIRYDRNAPSFLACLLPPGRSIGNPLYYYRGGIGNETQKIHTLLLSEMAASGIPITVATVEREPVDLARALAKKNLNAFPCFRSFRFPYLAPQSHNSPAGNLIVARQMFDSLTGKETSRLKLFDIKDVEKAVSSAITITRHAIREYDRMDIEVADMVIGRFGNAFRDKRALGAPRSANKEKCASLLALKEGSGALPDAVFLPVDLELADGMPLSMRIRAGAKEDKIFLGAVSLLNPNLNIGVVTLEDLIIRFPDDIEATLSRNRLKGVRGGGRGSARMEIFLGDTPVLKVETITKGPFKDRLKLSPLDSDFIMIRARGDVLLDPERVPEHGIVYLSLKAPRESAVRIPIARWSIREETVVLAQ